MKCGAVGLNDDSSRNNLKIPLSKHRSTHAKFVLLGGIQFIDCSTVTAFEN